MTANSIEKSIVLKHEKSRVWKALANSEEFGNWFGMKLEGPFAARTKIHGAIAPTTADPEVAKMQKPHEGKPVELLVDRIEPQSLFSFRWHPFAIDPQHDYSKESPTLVTFTLSENAEGLLLRVVESGFEKIPEARRAQAIAANDGGWAHQMQLIKKYLDRG